MKKGKTSKTLVVLALEILSIVVLHAVKLNRSEKNAHSAEISRNMSNPQAEGQQESKDRSVLSLAAYK